MGNRAVITTPERRVGLYLHWNGGYDTVAPLLRYCELKGYRAPSADCYGWGRLCQVLGNFFGGVLDFGIDSYSNDDLMDPGDNGIYVIEGWEIKDRIPAWHKDCEQREYDFNEMLHAFDEAMPESERLGGFLDSIEVPVGDLRIGDKVWMFSYSDGWKTYPVAGFGQPEFNRIPVWVDLPDGGRDVIYPDLPYVAWMDHDGDYSWNSNNYVEGPMARIDPR